jgi:hypothetical protein
MKSRDFDELGDIRMESNVRIEDFFSLLSYSLRYGRIFHWVRCDFFHIWFGFVQNDSHAHRPRYAWSDISIKPSRLETNT